LEKASWLVEPTIRTAPISARVILNIADLRLTRSTCKDGPTSPRSK
jgi:hypothetical protein